MVNRYGSMMSIFFGTDKVTNFDEAAAADHSIFNKFFHHMLLEGIYLPPSGYETYFISNAIQQTEIDKTLEAVK